MSSLADRFALWLSRARAQLATAAARVMQVRVSRQRPDGGKQPLEWHAHDEADRVARRTRRAMGEHRRGSRSGGSAVLQRYGARLYAAIGAFGGATLVQERGPEYMHDIGARGGAATRQRYGREHYAAIGRKGGLAGRG